MQTVPSRKLRPILAFIASVCGFGLGYVYVGRVRLAIGVLVSFYSILAFIAWTRLVTESAYIWWLACLSYVVVTILALVHPSVLAIKNKEGLRHTYNHWWFYGIWIVGVNALGFTLTTDRATIFGYEPFRIPSSSMSPTVEPDDFVLADTWTFRDHAAVAGDIVIVELPDRPGVKFIKRVVAVAGDSIEIKDRTVFRNGTAVQEPFVHDSMPYGGSPRNVSLVTLGPELIYVLGDYRDNSMDSRQWGPLSTRSLRGRVQYIWLSFKDRKIRWERMGRWLVPKQ